MGDRANPEVVQVLIDRFTGGALQALAEYSDEIGRRFVSARTIVAVDPEGLKIDQEGEVGESADGLAWYNNFNMAGYKQKISEGITEACDRWARGEFGDFFLIDSREVLISKRRP